MPTIAQTVQGRVTGLWGAALIRGADGKMRALKMGDLVHRGDVILTTQEGIVQISPEHTPHAAATPAASDDIDRVIAGLDNNDPTAATAAVGGADGAGEVTPGLRVERVSESIASSAGTLPSIDAGARSGFTTTNQITAVPAQGAAPTPAPAPAEPAPAPAPAPA